MTKRNFFCLLFLLSWTIPALGQQMLTGRVLDLNGQGIAEVEVTAFISGVGAAGPTTCASKTGQTDAQGNYAIERPTATPGSGCFIIHPGIGISYRKSGYNIFSLDKPEEAIGILQSPSVLTMSGASFNRDAIIANEMIVSLFGPGLADATASAGSYDLPTTLAGTEVFIRDTTGTEKIARLYYVGRNQINLLTPPDLREGTGAVVIRQNGTLIAGAFLGIREAYPGFFTASQNGQGVAAAVVQRHKTDGRFLQYEPVAQFLRSPDRWVPVPLDFGMEDELLYLTLFGTGLRHLSPDTVFDVKIGGVNAQVVYAGSQFQYPGVDQVNILLPRSLAGKGTVDVRMIIGPYYPNAVQIGFR